MDKPLPRREFLIGSAAALAAAACAPQAPAIPNGAPNGAPKPGPTASKASKAMTTARGIEQVFTGMPTTDGAGVSLTRVIGQPALRNLDPFLMLDRFHSDDPDAYIAGFPDHPHRGFETVTIMLDGRMRHRDHKGNSGLILGGGSQWMTAGRGIVHSEMPEQEAGLMSGFQLWVNLPAREKMRPPEYQDLQPDALEELPFGNGIVARLIAGTVDGVRGPVRDRVTNPLLLTLKLPPNAHVEIPVDRDNRAFAFVYQGDVAIDGKPQSLRQNELGIFENGSTRIGLRGGDRGAALLLAAATPLHEPIVQHGPFVMNTQEEIRQAFIDYRNGSLAKM